MATESRSILTALNSAARQGSLSAAFILGRLYDEGWGVEADPRKAFSWYLRAASAGLPEAFFFVGSAYDLGQGTRQDSAKALGWFRRAAAAGDKTGACMAAVAVFEGRGTRMDRRRGMTLLRKAAREGSHEAMDYLAAYYLSQRDRRQAKVWAERAIEAGNRVAALRLRDSQSRFE